MNISRVIKYAKKVNGCSATTEKTDGNWKKITITKDGQIFTSTFGEVKRVPLKLLDGWTLEELTEPPIVHKEAYEGHLIEHIEEKYHPDTGLGSLGDFTVYHTHFHCGFIEKHCRAKGKIGLLTCTGCIKYLKEKNERDAKESALKEKIEKLLKDGKSIYVRRSKYEPDYRRWNEFVMLQDGYRMYYLNETCKKRLDHTDRTDDSTVEESLKSAVNMIYFVLAYDNGIKSGAKLGFTAGDVAGKSKKTKTKTKTKKK